MVSAKREVKFMNYFGYSLVDIIGSGGFTLTSAWLLYFYTTFCGLTPLEAASIFAIARIFDAVMSPVMGYITDNFHKTKLGRRFGRRKFFLLISIPFVAIYSLMWVSGFTYLYYLLTYIGFEVVYSMIMIPYDTLAVEMTSDFKVRAKLCSARMYVANTASFIAAFLPGRLMSLLGKESPISFLYAGMIFTGGFIIALLFVYTCTWERSISEIKATESIDKKEPLSLLENITKVYVDFVTTVRIKSFRAHLGMYLGGSVAQDVFNAVFAYFVVFGLAKGATVASNFLGVINGLQVVGVAVATYLTLKFSPGAAFRIQSFLAIVAIVGYGFVYGLVPDSMVALYVVAVIAGIARGGVYAIPWNSYTFIADVDEIVSCDRREGLFAGCMCFLRKASQALSVFLVGVALQYFNFVSGAKTQPPEAINAMVFILLVIPVILTIVGIFSSRGFKITNKTHEILKNEVNRLKNNGSKAAVDPETKQVVEELTGLKYENLWGNNTIGYNNWKQYEARANNEVLTTKNS